jgi:hypothetical protein
MESFVKVLAANHYGIRGIKTVSTITGISENLVSQYSELIRTSKKDNQRRGMMKEMTQSWIRSEELKKRMLKSGYRAVVTAGGVL